MPTDEGPLQHGSTNLGLWAMEFHINVHFVDFLIHCNVWHLLRHPCHNIETNTHTHTHTLTIYIYINQRVGLSTIHLN